MNLVALLLSLAIVLQPGALERSATLQIVEATAYAIDHDPEAPIYGSREADAVVLLHTAWAESGFDLGAKGDGGRSRGAWQIQKREGRGDARTQAAMALRLLHWAARACPELPEAAYMSGSCRKARRLATERRRDLAEHLAELAATLQP